MSSYKGAHKYLLPIVTDTYAWHPKAILRLFTAPENWDVWT